MTCAVEASGVTCAVEARGVTCAVEASGVTCAVEARGVTCAVEASGVTCAVGEGAQLVSNRVLLSFRKQHLLWQASKGRPHSLQSTRTPPPLRNQCAHCGLLLALKKQVWYTVLRHEDSLPRSANNPKKLLKTNYCLIHSTSPVSNSSRVALSRF